MVDDVRRSPETPPRRLSKTLHNGLCILELLASRQKGATVSEIAEAIDVEWSVAQRLVLTLQHHDLVRRDGQKRLQLALGLIALAEPIEKDLRAVAGAALEELANSLGATSNLVILEGEDRSRALLVVEPTNASIHIAFRAGQVHPADRGAAGLAILAARPPRQGERAEIAEARQRGYAITHGENFPHVTGVSAPVLRKHGSATMSIGVSLFDSNDVDAVGQQVMMSAAKLARSVDRLSEE